VKSAMGSGTIFSFRIEMPNGKMEETPVQEEPRNGISTTSYDLFRSRRVLITEDNIANQKVLLRFLNKLGLQADTVANGAEAVASFRQKPYDVILMDCQMPEMDGYAATKMIREIEAAGGSPRTPIIALTANAFPSDRRNCLEAGMDDYVSKP